MRHAGRTGRRGKTIALWSVAAGVAVIAAGVVSSWDRIREEWRLYLLRSPNPTVRRAAAEALIETGSPRVIPRLLDLDEDRLLEKLIKRHPTAAEPCLAAALPTASGARACRLARLTLAHFPKHSGALEALERELGAAGPSRRDAALVVLKDVGEDPVLCLGRALGSGGGVDARVWIASKLEELGPRAREAIPQLAAAVTDATAEVRVAAACALARIGAEEDVFRKGLLEGLEQADRSVQRHALDVLKEVGRDSVPLGIGAVRSPLPEARLWACARFREMGPQGAEALPEIRPLLDEDAASTVESRAAQVMGALALAEMEQPPEVYLPVLARGLWIPDDSGYHVDRLSLSTILDLGPQAASILPAILEEARAIEGDRFNPWTFHTVSEVLSALGKEALTGVLELLRQASPQTKSLALMILRDLRAPPRLAIPALREALGDGTGEVAFLAAWALVRFGEHADEALPVLIRHLENELDPGRRRRMLALLGSLGAAARPAMGVLLRALRDGDWSLRLAAAEALGRLGPVAAEAIPALRRSLRDPERTVCWAAAAALGSFGEVARAAAPDLEKALGEPEPFDLWAAFALRSIEPARAAECLEKVREGLRSGSDLVRSEAIQALARMGPGAEAAVPDLIAIATREDDRLLHRLATEAIARIGLRDPSPLLANLLPGNDPAVRARAASSLAEAGTAAAEAVSALTAALADSDEAVRSSAARALGRLGAGSPAAAEALRRAARDRSLPVRQAARSALREISVAEDG